MLIHTAEGKRSIDDDLVLCIDRHSGESERCIVTLYLVSGEQVTGVLETKIPEDDTPPLAAGHYKRSSRDLSVIVSALFLSEAIRLTRGRQGRRAQSSYAAGATRLDPRTCCRCHELCREVAPFHLLDSEPMSVLVSPARRRLHGTVVELRGVFGG